MRVRVWVGLCVAVGLGAWTGPAAANTLSGRDSAGTRFFVDGSTVRVSVAERLVRRTAMRVSCVELVGPGMSSAYADLVTRRFAGRAGRRRWTVRFARDASRLINRCGLATGTRDVDLTDSTNGTAMRRLRGPAPGCRTGRREDLVVATAALQVTRVGRLVLRVCRRGDARPVDVDGFYGDLSQLHRWTSPTAVGDTVMWVGVDVAQGNDSLSVDGRIAGVPAVHRVDPRRLGSSDQRTYEVLRLACTAAGAFALLVHDNIAGRDVLYAGRLAADTGATVDGRGPGAITRVSVDDAAISWTADGREHTARVP